jgi:hypothetical protein
MLNQNTNYGERTKNSTSYIKSFNLPINAYNTHSTTFRGDGTKTCFIKTINPSKLNGSFVKTFNKRENYNS